MRVKYLQIQPDHMRQVGMKHAPAFLLIEVLVALVVFAVMVGVLSGFIAVWLNTDADQRARHGALAQVCDVLEAPGGQSALARARPTNVTVRPVDAQQVWAQVPAWARQLAGVECPVVYRVRFAERESGKRAAVCHQVTLELVG